MASTSSRTRSRSAWGAPARCSPASRQKIPPAPPFQRGGLRGSRIWHPRTPPLARGGGDEDPGYPIHGPPFEKGGQRGDLPRFPVALERHHRRLSAVIRGDDARRDLSVGLCRRDREIG